MYILKVTNPNNQPPYYKEYDLMSELLSYCITQGISVGHTHIYKEV